MTKRKVVLSWSSGKDSAWALHVLRNDPSIEVIALLSTISDAYGRVAMHGVRESLVEKQAAAAGLPLWKVRIPTPCSNDAYEKEMAKAVIHALDAGANAMAFGDLFLEDIRNYRLDKLAGTGLDPLFPLWKTPTDTLARTMLAAGLRAVITCVDTKQLGAEFSGLEFSDHVLDRLPPGTDPCGENGEFHTFCYAGPMFKNSIPITVGVHETREDFCFTDLF